MCEHIASAHLPNHVALAHCFSTLILCNTLALRGHIVLVCNTLAKHGCYIFVNYFRKHIKYALIKSKIKPM